MKILFLCCLYDIWHDVIRDCIKRGNTPIVIGWRDDRNRYIEAFADSITFYEVEKCWNRAYAGDKGIQYSEISFEQEDNMRRMMQRLIPTSINLRHDQLHHLIQIYFSQASAVLENVDGIVSPSSPHRVFDYAIYLKAKQDNVKFLTFQATPFGSTLLPTEFVERIELSRSDPGIFDGVPINEFRGHVSALRQNYSTAQPFYMKRRARQDIRISRYKELFRKVIRAFATGSIYKFKSPSTYLMAENVERQVGWTWYFLMNRKEKRFQTKLFGSYNKKSADWVFPAKYIYYGLHYQPEETTCPTSGVWANQLRVIDLLIKNLPQDVKIVIKEHPSQFRRTMEGARGRWPGFYNDLQNLSHRVIFAPLEVNSFDLIDNSIGVATNTGTVGFESVARSKYVLTFGRSWYEGCPGSFDGRDEDQLSDFVETVSNCLFDITDAELEVWFYKRFSQSLRTKHSKSNDKQTDISTRDSQEKLKRLLNDFFK